MDIPFAVGHEDALHRRLHLGSGILAAATAYSVALPPIS